MTITTEDVHKLAKLAKLRFSSREAQRLATELDAIVSYVRKLDELDTRNTPPTSYVLQPSNVLREDSVAGSLALEMVLSNAPKVAGSYFSMPRVIKIPK